MIEYSPLKDNENKIRRLVDYLVDGCPDHGFVIDYSLISLFLDNVHKGDYFGLEYAKKLTELSLLFIEDIVQETEYIDFVDFNNNDNQVINLPELSFDKSNNGTNFVPKTDLNQVEDNET